MVYTHTMQGFSFACLLTTVGYVMIARKLMVTSENIILHGISSEEDKGVVDIVQAA